MGSKSGGTPPPAPDYTGAAQATAQGNLQAARATQAGSLIGQNTPYGSLSYSQSGTDQFGNPMYTANVQLTPEQQQLMNAQQAGSMGYSTLANQGLMNSWNTLANPGLNQSTLPQAPINAGTTAQQAIMTRLQPQMTQQQNALNQNLANQGIAIGSEAWKNAQTQLGQQQNDLMNQAAYTGVGMDQAARQQAVQEQLGNQGAMLNQLNALRTGGQVSMPQFMNTPQMQGVTGPDILGATAAQGTYNQGLYNAQAGQGAGMMGGLFGLGSAAINKWSDRRLKKNIERIGTHPCGAPLYKFDYIWNQPGIGVMADELAEIMPEAVIHTRSGFDMVDYSRL